ncbi:serine hydrolase domain-containing protein [Terrarubrum flagellatum]|uniref:serine hydrolase domain-containing protein n=1 Tax=Terrirubrum flagellatum TaxID=2895980 RepID=UPI00314524A4
MTEATGEVVARGRSYPIHGAYDPRFSRVLDAFAENYRVEDEVGSAFSVVYDGVVVVDLWGGWRDAVCSMPWERDTIVCMMSVVKGICGISFNRLIDLGLVHPDKPVAAYWPEFAQGGKDKLPVRYVLDHRAGLPVVTANLPRGAMFDRKAMTEALAAQAPLWEPGAQAGYHIHTQGYMLSEITRRVTGKTIAQYFRDEIAIPLNLDYQIGGLSPADQARCAELQPVLEGTLFAVKDSQPDTLVGKAFAQNPDEPWPVTLNSRAWREAEIASANGHGNARAVARLYGAIARGGELDGVRVLSPRAIDRMIIEQHNLTEVMQNRPYHQGLGVLLNTGSAVWMGPNPKAFGHHGIGGSIGMGDVDAKLGIAYSINRMHARGDNGPRARRLIEAVYACL